MAKKKIPAVAVGLIGAFAGLSISLILGRLTGST